LGKRGEDRSSLAERPIAWGAHLAAVLSLLSGIAIAEPSPAAHSQEPPGDAALEAVIVEAQRERERLERQIRAFATSIILPRREESLARWQVPICPLVAGLTPEQGEFVLKRVSQIVRDSGAPLAPEKCKANLVIVMTPEPASFLRGWWKRNPKFFNDGRGLGDTEIFIRTPKPIRVWYNVQSKCPNGRATYETEGSDGGTAYLRCVDGTLGSKLRWEAVRKIVSAIMIADTALIEGRTIGQLADYIAMVALAQLRRDAEPGSVPTILHLFNGAEPATSQRLSRWDEAFLRSVYASDPESVLQVSEVQAKMYQDLMR
jgi:hypothetical protein